MRLAVAIAAWSSDPDDTLPPAHEGLSSALSGLGFSIVRVPLTAAKRSLSAALTGLEPGDTLLVHVSGVLGGSGAVETSEGCLPLDVIGEVLAASAAARALVFVEVAYRGSEDALAAVEEVEGVTDALTAPGDRAVVVAVHPWRTDSKDGVSLAFTRAVLGAAHDVAQADGTAQLAEAYAHARKQEGVGVAARAYAFLSGDTRFELGRGLAPPTRPTLVEAPALPTEPEITGSHVTEVRFLVDGQQRPNLAGHADLTRTYLTADAAPAAGGNNP